MALKSQTLRVSKAREYKQAVGTLKMGMASHIDFMSLV